MRVFFSFFSGSLNHAKCPFLQGKKKEKKKKKKKKRKKKKKGEKREDGPLVYHFITILRFGSLNS